jgi:phage terminase small subunit
MSGPLKNPRHERFAQAIVKGMTLPDAYAAAGYIRNEKNAARLMKNEGVAARIAELQAEVARNVVVDAAWVLNRAVELHNKALEAKAFSVAKGALDIIGRHVDVQAFREQIQHSGSVELKSLTDEQLEAKIAALTGGKYVPRLTTH